jgi:hypothetical protein
MADFKTFGRELVRLNIGAAVGALSKKSEAMPDTTSEPLIPSAYRGGMYFFGDGTAKRFFDYDDIQSALQAFTICPPLQSIILRKAEAAANARLWIMTSKGKGKNRECKTEWADKCRAKLARPNPFETWSEFDFNMTVYTNLFGWCVVYPTYSTKMFAGKGMAYADNIWVLPPSMLDWLETGRVFNQLDLKGIFQYIRVQTQELNMELPLQDIAIIRGNLPRMNSGSMGTTLVESMILPDTKVRACQQVINNIVAAYESRGELIGFAGAQNIISPEANAGAGIVAMPLNPEEEKDLQDKFKKQYGVMRKQYRNIISPQPIKVQKMGTATKDLMLFEEVEEDVKALCDQWGYPYKLLSNSKSTSLNGTEARAFQSFLYTDTIIPESQHKYNQLAKAFKAGENNCVFEVDFSHVPALQEDKQKHATARKVMGEAVANEFKTGLITYNRAMELMEEDTVEWGNIYYWDFKKLYNIQDEPAQQQQGQSEAGTNQPGIESEIETANSGENQ